MPPEGWHCPCCPARFSHTTGIRRHAVLVHGMWFRSLSGIPSLVPIPDDQLPHAREKARVGGMHASRRRRHRRRHGDPAAWQQAPALDDRHLAGSQPADSAPGPSTSPLSGSTSSSGGAPDLDYARGSNVCPTATGAGADESADPDELRGFEDIDFDIDEAELAFMPELSGELFEDDTPPVLPVPSAAAAPAPRAPTPVPPEAAPVIEELPPTWLPAGLQRANVAAFVAAHPALSAFDINSMLLGRLDPSVSPTQAENLRQTVLAAVDMERQIVSAAAIMHNNTIAAGGDLAAAYSNIFSWVMTLAQRPRHRTE